MSHSEGLIVRLEQTADRLRWHSITQFEHLEQGHVGGTLSVIDLVTALYFHHLNFDPTDPDSPDRDRVVLSKAHSCEAIYAALVELGVYPEETLKTYYCYGSPFQGHADRCATIGIDYSGGSLGQGLSFAAGMAYAEKLKVILDPPPFKAAAAVVRYNPAYRTFCILGDGECHEGQVWEAAMFATKYRLDNLVAIVDYNKFTLGGPTSDILPLEPFVDRWQDFGWWVTEIDGHNMRQVVEALELTSRLYGDGKPKCIIAHTVKGHGVSVWEDLHLHIGREGEAMASGIAEGKRRFGQAR